MSSFSLPPLSGFIQFDVSAFTGGMSQVAASAGEFPGIVASGIDEPLRNAQGQFVKTAGAAEGIGDAVEHGMLASQAAMQLFPPLVIELIEDPLLGAIAVVGELGEKVGEIVGEMANHFRSIGLESLKTGLDPETLSTFGAAAQQSGVSIQSLANGMELLQQRAAAAMAGDEQGIKGFENLGISATQLAGMMNDPKEMLLTVADAMAALPTQGERVRVAMEAMGRGGKEMLPFLQQGRDGITELADHLGNLGARVGTEETAMGATWAKLGADFSAMWEGVETKLASPVLQYLQEHADAILPTIETIAQNLGDGIGIALQAITPWVETIWGFASGLGDTLAGIGQIVMPLLEAVLPIIELIADVLKTIVDLAGASLNGFAGVLHEIAGDGDGADAAFKRANSAADRVAGDLGFAPAGGVNIEKVEVKLDPHESSQQIADKLRPDVAAGYEKLKEQQKAAAGHAKVARAVGGHRR